MYRSDKDVSFCDGFQNGKFKMSSNVSTFILQIKRVDLSDSGLYFCGLYIGTHTVISTANHLNVKVDGESDDEADCNTQSKVLPSSLKSILIVKVTIILIKRQIKECNSTMFLVEEPDGMTTLMSVILGGLTAVLTIVIIVLAVKIRKLQTAVKEEAQPERNKNLGSDQLDSAALKFLPQTIRNRRSASERQVETHVIYAASR
uniref:Immunoglobulin V-set domain-containing protein n=1 Tax=Dicentrarchus labrax TaxID=13489 RepID=A0A8C4GZS9_DICLA